MSRITKDPQIRMVEIIDAAEDLFNAHGYQETQISDIVKAIGVSQGTFYYYFKAKEEVLEAIVRRKADRLLAENEDIAAANDIDAPRKLDLIVHKLLKGICGHDDLIFACLFSEQNLHISDKFARQYSERFSPLVKNIIDEGIEQGYFNITYPEETVEFVLGNIRVLIDSLYKKGAAARLEARLEITQKLVEAALGAAKGSLSFKN